MTPMLRKHLLRLGLTVAVALLAGCAGAGRTSAPLARAALTPQPGESASGFEQRCLGYVTDHAPYAEAGRCMDEAARMRLAAAPPPPPVPLASVVRAVPRKLPPRQLSPASAVAADVRCGTAIGDASADGGHTVAITVSGMIMLSCKARIEHVVADATRKFPKAQLYFVLNSPGGSLATAMQMARIVAADRLPVVVPSNAMCASACFLILAASHTKYVALNAHVGVHSAAESRPGNETEGSKAVTTDFARLLAQLGVPSEIIGRLVETPPGAIYWLSPEELMTMGVRPLPT
ncbi:MAG: ATP-dependent Clp protease proteolytic subunit [Rhodospirillales bacterium]|nr:ATP-dependent Clp protease proteolytic subunit [Rhodospirillales bacterium]